MVRSGKKDWFFYIYIYLLINVYIHIYIYDDVSMVKSGKDIK